MNTLKSDLPELWRFLKALAANRWIVTLVSTLFLGVAVGLFPVVMGVLVLGALAFAVVYFTIHYRRASQRQSAYTRFELALLSPDSDALARLHAANEDFLVLDRVIEVLPHYSLTSHAHFASLGWAPENILVHFDNQSFDASEILARVGGRKDFEPPNGRKFCLTDRSLAGTDQDLSLYFQETDYFTICSVLSNLPFSLRSEFGSLDPAESRIPHSMCLHFIVRLDDGSVLLLLNERRKRYSQGTWSVSAEEQLKDSDLSYPAPILALFQRAILEEVFGLSDNRIPLEIRWNRIKAHVGSTRIWSLFLEEHISNFSLLGVCQLSVNPTKLREIIDQLTREGSAARDAEGKLYFAPRVELEKLLMHREATATGLFSGAAAKVLAENLHWTSRYRIFRLLRALNGKPLSDDQDTTLVARLTALQNAGKSQPRR